MFKVLDSMIKETYNQIKDYNNYNIDYELIETMFKNKGFLQDKENLKLDFDNALNKIINLK